jgi:hypothetical protein
VFLHCGQLLRVAGAIHAFDRATHATSHALLFLLSTHFITSFRRVRPSNGAVRPAICAFGSCFPAMAARRTRRSGLVVDLKATSTTFPLCLSPARPPRRSKRNALTLRREARYAARRSLCPFSLPFPPLLRRRRGVLQTEVPRSVRKFRVLTWGKYNASPPQFVVPVGAPALGEKASAPKHASIKANNTCWRTTI